MLLGFPRWKLLSVIGACLIFFILALPNFMRAEQAERLPSWLPSGRVNLGLDLQGGSHLLLEVDFGFYQREQMQHLLDQIRTKLRAEKLGYKGLAVKGDRAVFSLRTGPDRKAMEPEKLRSIFQDINADAQWKELSTGNYEVTYDENYWRDAKRRLLEQSIEIVNRRINETGTKEPIIQRQGEDRILLQVPGLENPEKLKRLLGQTAKMTFHMVDLSVSPEDIARGDVPPGVKVFPLEDRSVQGGEPARYAVEAQSILSGDLLRDSSATYHNGAPVVSFQFNTEGARKFGDITTKNSGKLFAVVLDEKIITAPRINEPILGGSGIITGSFSVEEANQLALLLRAGALPAPLKVIEERSVGPSLGADSVEDGKMASLVGVLLVILFMLLVYGLFGFFANVALIMDLVMILAALSLFQATLTLPGIAGIVLTLGMSVDTNVLIFERMREEAKLGKSLIATIDSGFKMAFSTIIDTHLTTFIAALLLYYFGTGTVKGFAVTLAIGILASLFSAVVITRLQVSLWLKYRKPKMLPRALAV